MNSVVNRKYYARITTWEDISKMSGYTDSLDPKKEKLKQVINRYELPIKGKCGLSNCGTAHFRGYIVETESGKLTNLGHICGNNHFGLNFTSLKNKLDKEVDYFNKIESTNLAKSNIAEKYRELSEIKDSWKKIESVYRTIKSEGLDGLYDKLEQMKHSKSSVISTQRKATKPEIELEETRTGKDVQKPFYITESLGNLKGLKYLIERIKIKDMLQNNKIILESLEEFDENIATFKDLNRIIKENERLKDSIREAHSIIREGFKLFEKNNMKQFTPLISNKRHRKLKRFLNACFVY